MSPRKVAIVTGSATGVGAATALALARRQFNVVINYSKSAAEAQLSAAACIEAGANALVIQADVADDAACRGLAEAAIARWGRIDALVNNAGITSFAGTANWDVLDAQTFQDILGVNVVGAFQMVRACTPHLKAAQGTIVNISSVAGALGVGSSVPYIASKGAINALTLHLARSLAPDIRVNAVCPGLITTRWFVDGIGAEAYQKLKTQYEQSTPLGRACTAEDVAESVLWLIEGARTVTGELILLDSGMHLGRATTVPGRAPELVDQRPGTAPAAEAMAPSLRDAHAEDYAALATWLQDRAEVIQWCGQALPLPLAPAELERQVQEAQTRSCIWSAEAGPIAFGQYGMTRPGTVHLARLIVRPELRGRGHGRALCAALMAAASAGGGVRAMTIDIRRDHIAARNLCSSLGFQEVAGAADPPWMFMRRMVRPTR
jgi:3-oxoacyl-[acyl-carrier protein] reductase